MAKSQKDKKPRADVKIGSRNELVALFQKLAAAYNRILAAATVRDAAKNQADEAYEEQTAADQAVMSELHDPVLDYVIAHKAELIPDGKQSAEIGPATVEFRVGNPVIVDLKGKAPKDATILAELETAIKRARGENKALLEACIDYKPKLKKDELKKLPAALLQKLSLRVEQPEKVDWKPNAER